MMASLDGLAEGDNTVTAEENKALVRRYFDAQTKGDLAAVEEMMTLDFVNHHRGSGQERSREGYIREAAEDRAACSDLRYIIEDQAADGDRVLSRFTIRGIHDRREWRGFAPTEMEFEAPHISIYRIAGGKIAEEWREGGGLLELTQERLEQEIRERERLEQELLVARRIQLASLPEAVPTLEGWQISPHYRPAREVGGDFYDFHLLSEGKLGLVVGDATGKGVPAALVMASARSMLRALAQASNSPGDVLRRVNDALVTDIPPNMFVTCFYAILDPKSGSMSYANAGHDLPYLHRNGEAEELRARGMPLGLMPGMSYEEKETILEAGEAALFYSDGLVEAHDPKGEMFGFPRLRVLVGEHDGADGSPIDRLLNELSGFVGDGWEQEDDITLVTLERSEEL
jgi:serine phosphatase RsbU (regulator of sigma subunit)/predicted ester cyclase